MTYSSDFITGLRIFELVPGNNLLLKANSPRFTILAVSDGYVNVTGKSRQSLIDNDLFDVFPMKSINETGDDALFSSLNYVIENKRSHQLLEHRYDLYQNDTNNEKRFWRIYNSPVLGTNDNVNYIISTVEDVTADVLMKDQEEKLKPLQQAHNLYMQAPMSIQIYKGYDLIIELANDLTLEMWDRDRSSIGKPLLEVLPELKGHGYEHMMHEVMKTGVSKSFYETPVILNKGGKEHLGYYNFVYQPFYEESKNEAVGVLVFSTEVTEQVITR